MISPCGWSDRPEFGGADFAGHQADRTFADVPGYAGDPPVMGGVSVSSLLTVRKQAFDLALRLTGQSRLRIDN